MNLLNQIITNRKFSVNAEKQQNPTNLSALKTYRFESMSKLFIENLKESKKVLIISEYKRKSPSHSEPLTINEPHKQAEIYKNLGTSAISVLTEPSQFGGSANDIVSIREHIQNGCPPILYKDFVIDEYQIYQAREVGASLILLIVKILPVKKLELFYEIALSLDLLPLIEVFDEVDLEIANSLKPLLLGINNRNLDNLKIDLNNFIKLAPLAHSGSFLVSESGISTFVEAQKMASAGAYCLLIGEALLLDDYTSEYYHIYRL